MLTADKTKPAGVTLPPLESDHITFHLSCKDGIYTKQLLIDGHVVHALEAAYEPDDYQVYVAYLSKIRDRKSVV